jgi:hypothetical protein
MPEGYPKVPLYERVQRNDEYLKRVFAAEE